MRIYGHEAAAELLAFANVDEPRVVPGVSMTRRQQLFEQDRHLDTVRRAEGVELQGGCRPIGNSASCVGPATGRLMFAKRPPLGLLQTQTSGGV